MLNLILVGFSYTGKSAVGRAASARLQWPLVDTDELVAQRAGRTIQEIFATQGESFFRELEKEAIYQACTRRDVVVSTGGGAVIEPHNRTVMANSGVVVCLEARAETILKRMKASQAARKDSAAVRPLLLAEDPLAQITSMKEHRQVYYAACDWTVHTDYLRTDEVVAEVLRGFDTVRKAREKVETP